MFTLPSWSPHLAHEACSILLGPPTACVVWRIISLFAFILCSAERVMHGTAIINTFTFYAFAFSCFTFWHWLVGFDGCELLGRV
ncbi:hypothetical protein BDR03DRAFT_971428 [Suillus americanus]|nr:hypothetical protein BDR03DRAFT_971428 [Suillus americanus]